MKKNEPGQMDSLSSVIKVLYERGYGIDYNTHQGKEDLLTNHEQYRIEKIYRFEGMTNPEDEAILYSIVSTEGIPKGILVNGYGISSDEMINVIIEKILRYK